MQPNFEDQASTLNADVIANDKSGRIGLVLIIFGLLILKKVVALSFNPCVEDSITNTKDKEQSE